MTFTLLRREAPPPKAGKVSGLAWRLTWRSLSQLPPDRRQVIYFPIILAGQRLEAVWVCQNGMPKSGIDSQCPSITISLLVASDFIYSGEILAMRIREEIDEVNDESKSPGRRPERRLDCA
jgi:hypothetical protein